MHKIKYSYESKVTNDFQTDIPKSILELVNIKSNDSLKWNVTDKNEILIEVGKFDEDLDFARKSDEALERVEKRGFKPQKAEDFLKEMESW